MAPKEKAEKAGASAEAPPPPPAFSSITEAFQQILASINEQLDRMDREMPPEADPTIHQVRSVVNTALEGFNVENLRAMLFTELVDLATTGRSRVRHDPSELA